MIKILKYGEVSMDEVFARVSPSVNVEGIVSEIIENVKKNGDKALFEYCEKFDKAVLSELLVSQAEIDEAVNTVDPKFLEILEKAAANIRRFHEKQVRNSFILNDRPGIVMGQKIIPVDRAGLYVPGGTAAYPSTVLMDSIPAKIAGINKIFKVGGAQAIAALAYGTESIPKVDKIVGPGNAFVAEAKKQVFGRVSIDMIAGPSEILVIADGASNPRHVAADLLSQAEHDTLASAVLVTDSADLAKKVRAELEVQIPLLERADIARASIDNNGKIIVADDLRQAIDIANEIAPEHLELCVDNPFDYLDAIRHAGSIFMGRNCPEALGDYFAGPNHTLPTSGTAKFSSPLGVDDFIKKVQYTYYTKDALAEVAQNVATFARAEGLTAHARSATIRTEDDCCEPVFQPKIRFSCSLHSRRTA